jgi:hypothetical protein
VTAAVAVVHATSGRLRLRVRATSTEVREVLDRVAHTADASPLRVSTNLRTRSALVAWNPSELDVVEAVELLRNAHPALHDLTPPPDAIVQPRRQSTVATHIAKSLSQADRRVFHATEGVLDLRMLVPIGLAAYSVRQLIRTGPQLGKTPWYVLAYYAFDTFIKLHDTPPGDLAPIGSELKELGPALD